MTPAIKRRLTVRALIIRCGAVFAMTDVKRQVAETMMTIASPRNAVAIARGTYEGCIRENRAAKPMPMPIDPMLVRVQLAKVRSLANIVRSSARSLRVGASSLWSAIPVKRTH